LIAENRYHTSDTGWASRSAALAAGIALQGIPGEAVRHTITFHRSIRAAEVQGRNRSASKRADGEKPPHHFPTARPRGSGRTCSEFRDSPSALIATRGACRKRGHPAVDCVFADPKQASSTS
jgi:hypothetical protein